MRSEDIFLRLQPLSLEMEEEGELPADPLTCDYIAENK